LNNVKKDDADVKKLKVVLCQNCSLVSNGLADYKEALIRCTEAIAVDDTAVKAYYQRSVAHRKTKCYDEAMADLKTAIKLNPQDKKMRLEFEQVKEEKKHQ